jgi:lipopolysaccharide export system protein LptA
MRGTRWLLLVAIVAILGGVGATYRAQKKLVKKMAVAKPQDLPEDVGAQAKLWTFVEYDGKTNRIKAEISAKDMTEVKDSSRVDLRGVTLKLPSRKGDTYNLVKSAAAEYYRSDHRLYSPGDVEITLAIPFQGKPRHQLVTIHSSAVGFNSESGHAQTEQPSTFTFENGTGKATGADYDPESHELRMKEDVEIHYKPETPNGKPMVIEAGSLLYHEAGATIELSPWGRLTRDTLVVEGETPVIQLQNHEIHSATAKHAHGVNDDPDRKVQYAADELWMGFNDHGEIQTIAGQGNAKLVSYGATSETTVTADHVELAFDVQNHESLLTRVAATGHGVAASRPLPAPGREIAETHVLSSDNLEMRMRPGGKEISSVETHSPGTLEFLPNVPAQHHRILTGNNMRIIYGAENRIDTFRATDVKTLTDANAEERKHNRAQSKTSSREIVARFDPGSSHMASMEQTGNVQYAEGDRQAVAAHATLDNDKNIIVLEHNARMWDSNGSTSAEAIRMDQRTGDYTAEGNVNSSRMPEKDPKKNSQMLSGDEPLQAQARRMVSADKNKVVHYEGNVAMWQGASRIQADTIDLNREKRQLVADGNVVSNLWEEHKDDPNKSGDQKKKTGPPVLTVVRAPHMAYTDDNRLAVYSGGVVLKRSGMEVKCKELRAYLSEQGADSRLERAFADGTVEIRQTAPGRVRTGTADHSEYYTADQKVILRGGSPKLVDSLKGSTIQAPQQLTYYANDDRLLGDGAPGQPVESRLNRSRK